MKKLCLNSADLLHFSNWNFRLQSLFPFKLYKIEGTVMIAELPEWWVVAVLEAGEGTLDQCASLMLNQNI